MSVSACMCVVCACVSVRACGSVCPVDHNKKRICALWMTAKPWSEELGLCVTQALQLRVEMDSIYVLKRVFPAQPKKV